MDELNDEAEARMDRLTDEVRRLTSERDTARTEADRCHGVAHRMEAERDAAVQALDDLRVSWGSLKSNHAGQVRGSLALKAERDSLRAQLSEAREREGRYREALEAARYQLDILGSDTDEIHAAVLATVDAALSPSPARCLSCGAALPLSTETWVTCPCGARQDGTPSPASGVVVGEPKPRLVAAMVCPHTTEFVCSRCAAPGKDGATQ